MKFKIRYGMNYGVRFNYWTTESYYKFSNMDIYLRDYGCQKYWFITKDECNFDSI